MDRLYMQEMRDDVDVRYVGFRPNSGSIKPVHVSTGVFRAILGETYSAEGIKILSYVCNAKGEPPNKKETLEEALLSVKQYLEDNDAVDASEITDDQLVSLRSVLQKLVSADKGVFGIDDGMLSYTAGSSAFVTAKGALEDAGDLVGELINAYCPELSKYVKYILKSFDDPISQVFQPVLHLGEYRSYEFALTEEAPLDKIEAFRKPNHIVPELKRFLENTVKTAGKCLLANLERHPNKLTQLRLFNLFCSFLVIRYLSLLEVFYCGDDVRPRPILLDFSQGTSASLSRTSILSYSQFHKSISRFYAWAYSEWLKEHNYDKSELMNSSVPFFRRNKGREVLPKALDGCTSVWNMAQDEARNSSEQNALLLFGAAINDMAALEASSHPVNYLRKLGTEIGLLYPPLNLHKDKRFLLTGDMLEVLLRCSVLPGETLTSSALRDNLWQRFGIIIGGGNSDVNRLNSLGSIVYADTDALTENWNMFAYALQNMSFAEQLPDGILQIGFGGRMK